jgi:ribosomal protein L30E
MNNILGNLGLCKRAGKIITGFDAVLAALQGADGKFGKKAKKTSKTKVAGIVLARDLSEKTKKEICFQGAKYGAEIVEIDCTLSEIESVLNKKTGIIAILDRGLFALLAQTGQMNQENQKSTAGE